MQLIGLTADLMVEGDDGAGPFRGRVLAIALDDRSPGSTAEGPSAASTWMLIADEERSGPIWVTQSSVTAQRLGR